MIVDDGTQFGCCYPALIKIATSSAIRDFDGGGRAISKSAGFLTRLKGSILDLLDL